jgi:hypothetical protein
MSTSHDPRQNHLLAALPVADFERLQSGLRLVPLPLGDVLYESGSELRHVYFPTTAIVSLLYLMADAHPLKSQWLAPKASSVLRSSWAVKRRRAVRSCRAQAMPPN